LATHGATEVVKPIIRLLFLPREVFPTDRVRINVLFGRELLARGHAIDLVMQAAHDGIATGARSWNGRTIWLGPTDSADGLFHRMRKHWLALRHDLRSLSLANPRHYDAVLVSDKFLVASIAVLVAHIRGLKFIYWLTFPYPESDLDDARSGTARYPALTRFRGVTSRWLLYKWILPRSAHVFVQSARMKEDIGAHGIDPAKISPVVTGFDPSSIFAARPHVDPRGSAGVTLAYLGTLVAARHLEILVDMLARLRSSGMPVRLLLVGHADRERDRLILERHASELGVGEHMEITGFLPQREALARVRQADICLSPFYPSPVLLSTSPTKLVEYLALGCPVVANDHPEQRLILRESRAGVCVPWGARHFARAVRWLMARSQAERAAMGSRGRAWVECNRTYARIADQMERTLIAVVAR
jgi:glycosyltransferase involved in cell wall biosynthesis